MAGRPTKLTPEMQDAYLTALRRTRYLETAADLAGIERSVVWRWIKRGRRESGIHRAFCNAVKKVLAECEATNLDTIEEASPQEWTAAAWLLERRFPKRWGRKDRHEVTGDKGGPVIMKVLGPGAASMEDL